MAATMDEALEVLKGTGPEYDGGLSNHAPMGAEVLFTLGHPEAAIPWVEAYKSRLEEEPRERDPIDRKRWQETLGDPGRAGDSIAFFDRGSFGSGSPTGARGDGRRNSRIDPYGPCGAELVPRAGPGPWLLDSALPGASRYSLREDSGHQPKGAIHHVRRSHTTDFEPGRLIFEQVQGLDDEPDFAGVIHLVDTAGDISAFIFQWTETFAGLYLKNQRFIIAYVHVVTAPSAIGRLTSTKMMFAWLPGMPGKHAPRCTPGMPLIHRLTPQRWSQPTW